MDHSVCIGLNTGTHMHIQDCSNENVLNSASTTTNVVSAYLASQHTVLLYWLYITTNGHSSPAAIETRL